MDQLIDDLIKFSLWLSLNSSLMTSFAFGFIQVNELDGCLFDSEILIFLFMFDLSTKRLAGHNRSFTSFM